MGDCTATGSNVHGGNIAASVYTTGQVDKQDTSGGMGPTASVVFRRLASLLSIKQEELYSKIILFIRCLQLDFALLRSAVRCIVFVAQDQHSLRTVPSQHY